MPRIHQAKPRMPWVKQVKSYLGKHRYRPEIEIAEERILLSTFTVMNNNDSGTNSLRWCINQANNSADNTIEFSPGLTSPIQLLSVLPTLKQNMAITGPGASSLTILGGGASSNFSVLTINSGVTARISGLTISGGYATSGGGIYNLGQLTATDCVFSKNQATNGGGGIENGVYGTASQASVILTDCTFSNNSNGIVSTGTMTLTDCTISHNSRGLLNAGTATLTGCTISNNTAPGATSIGGGITDVGKLTMINCTIAGNTAASAGGIYVDAENGSSANLINCTITGNRATTYDGGGIRTYGLTVMVNTIIVGNFKGASPTTIEDDITGDSTVTNPFNNLIGTPGKSGLTTDGNGNRINVSVASLKLGTLGNYGGLTQTIPLQAGSQAINAGNNSKAVDASGKVLATDQRGFIRVVDGIVDVGAYEAPGTYKVTIPSDDGTIGDLRDSIRQANLSPGSTIDLSSLTGTITLTGGPLVLSQDVTIIGSKDGQLTIQGGGDSSVFIVDSGVNAAISDLKITGGSAIYGGGVNNSGTTTLTDCTISNDTATYGGGVYNSNSGNLTLKNCTISGDTATNNGGGICNDGILYVLVGCGISGNTADTYGGGIYNSGELHLNGCTISDDNAISGGGLYSTATGTVIIVVGCFTGNGNSSTSHGGGIYNIGVMTLVNCTIANDTADIGGGIDNDAAGKMTLTNCTVSGNRANRGGGIESLGSSILINTIVAGNFLISPSTTPSNIAGLVDTINSFNNLIGKGGAGGLTPGGNNKNQVDVDDPGLGPLGNNGGSTQTIPLEVGSPAIDAGNNDLARDDQSNLLTTDQRGVTRVVNGIVDIGAYELYLQEQTITFGTFVDPKYGNTFNLSATATSGLPITKFIVDSGPANVSPGNVLTFTGVGPVTIKAIQAGDSNYAAATGDLSFTVKPATLTVTPYAGQHKKYGDPVPTTLTYASLSGWANDADKSLLHGSLGTNADASSPAGFYSFNKGSLDAGNNYTFAIATNVMFEVTKANLIVTAKPITLTTGQTPPPIDLKYIQFDRLANNDQPESLYKELNISASIQANAGSPVGNYPISISGAPSSQNYNVVYHNGTLTYEDPKTSHGPIPGPPTPVNPTIVVNTAIQTIKIAKHKTAKGIVLFWNAALKSDDATNTANYRLTTVASKKKKAQVVAITQVVYQPGSTSEILLTSKPLNLKNPMQLRVISGGLHDAAGYPVGSTVLGQKGADFLFSITKSGVQPQAITASRVVSAASSSR